MGLPVKYSVYMHRNKKNGKVYIGVTKQKPEKRFQNGVGYKYTNSMLWEDIVSQGWDNFEHIILFQGLTKEEASDKEKELVSRYNSTDPRKGYNRIAGGFRPCRPDVSEYMKARTGILNPNFGKKAPPKTRQALLEHARYGQFGGNNHKAKSVQQFTKEGKFIAEYASIADAKRKLGLLNAHIAECCKEKRKTANGYIWKYGKEC